MSTVEQTTPYHSPLAHHSSTTPSWKLWEVVNQIVNRIWMVRKKDTKRYQVTSKFLDAAWMSSLCQHCLCEEAILSHETREKKLSLEVYRWHLRYAQAAQSNKSIEAINKGCKIKSIKCVSVHSPSSILFTLIPIDTKTKLLLQHKYTWLHPSSISYHIVLQIIRIVLQIIYIDTSTISY